MTLLCELGKIKAITQQIFYCYLVRLDDTLQMTVFILESSNLGELYVTGKGCLMVKFKACAPCLLISILFVYGTFLQGM